MGGDSHSAAVDADEALLAHRSVQEVLPAPHLEPLERPVEPVAPKQLREEAPVRPEQPVEPVTPGGRGSKMQPDAAHGEDCHSQFMKNSCNSMKHHITHHRFKSFQKSLNRNKSFRSQSDLLPSVACLRWIHTEARLRAKQA